MIPLAVSGTIVISIVVAGALAILTLLLRAEDRADAEEKREQETAEGSDRAP
jgi:NhaP-type Na+/H+ or K+/H+ antiporter